MFYNTDIWTTIKLYFSRNFAVRIFDLLKQKLHIHAANERIEGLIPVSSSTAVN